MPLKSTVKQIIQEANIYTITSFSIDVSSLRLHVEYRLGIEQIDGKVIYASGAKGFDADIKSYMVLFPSSSLNYYDNIKQLLYKIGQDVGEFPAGTVK